MKCEINFEANQVAFYRRGDSDGQIPALVSLPGQSWSNKVTSLTRRRTQPVAICAVQLTVRRQRKSPSLVRTQLHRQNFSKTPRWHDVFTTRLGTGKSLRLASKPDRTNYVGGGNEWGAKQNSSRFG